jgi:hypothetical protein
LVHTTFVFAPMREISTKNFAALLEMWNATSSPGA